MASPYGATPGRLAHYDQWHAGTRRIIDGMISHGRHDIADGPPVSLAEEAALLSAALRGSEMSTVERLCDIVAVMLVEQMRHDGREWSMPAEPGPEVTAVRAAKAMYDLTVWHRRPTCWLLLDVRGASVAALPWDVLLPKLGPLTDATLTDGTTGEASNDAR